MNTVSRTALSVAVILGLAACSPANKSETSQQATSAKEVKAPMVSGLDVTSINKEARPQDDFYQYANGAWMARTTIPDDKSRFGMFNVLHDQTQERLKSIIQEAAEAKAAEGSNEQKLGDMYNSFMNQQLANRLGVNPLKGQLRSISGISSKDDVAQKMGELFALGVGGMFGFYVWPDAKDPNTYAMWMYQDGLSLPDKEYYFKEEEKYVNYRSALETYIGDLLELGGWDSDNDPREMAQLIMDLETRIAGQHMSKTESRDAEKNYNRRTPSDVSALLDSYNWQKFAQGTGLPKIEHMVVTNLSYFESVSDIFAETDVATLKAYMAYKLMDTYAPRLSDDFVNLNFAFHGTTLSGVPENRPRWKRAVSGTSSVLGEVLGQQYVARHFTPEAKAKMTELVENLIKAYGQSIKDLTWMGDETKEAALLKLSQFTPKVGYPDKWRDYSKLTIKPKDLVGNYFRYNRFEQDYWVARIGKTVDPADWGMTPQTINAYYAPTRNEIVFPAGILQPPFFNLEAEDAVNYGAIGTVIGHEIGHGFDDQGSKFDGGGNLRSWWTDADREAFDVLGNKLAAQYDKYEPLEGLFVNGQLTKGENIGDLAGMTIAHKAYLLSLDGKPAPEIDGFTGSQRVFLGHAQAWRSKYRDDRLRSQVLSDPHSPSVYRVNGVVVNVDAFYDAFDVKDGDSMYLAPEERVHIW